MEGRGQDLPAAMASSGHSGISLLSSSQDSSNWSISGIASHSARSLSVKLSIFPLVSRSLLRICLANTVSWFTNSSSRKITGFVVRGSGGKQSPMPLMPSGRPRVMEYCWSMCSIHHHSICRRAHSRGGGAGSRYLGLRCRPMEWARRIVRPNSVHASRKRPLFVRYGPIMINVWIASSVGRFMKDAMRRACIAAATVVAVSMLRSN